jgi:hypothetical protein
MCHAVRSAMAQDTAPASSAFEISSPGKGFLLLHLRRDWLAAATSAPGHSASLPHLHWVWAHRCHICAWTPLILATFATLLGSLPPHPDSAQSPTSFPGLGTLRARSAPGLGTYALNLQRDRAHACRIFTGTGVTCASASQRGSPLPHLRRDSANPARPQQRRDWAHPCHICAVTGRIPATSALGLGHPHHVCAGTYT